MSEESLQRLRDECKGVPIRIGEFVCLSLLKKVICCSLFVWRGQECGFTHVMLTRLCKRRGRVDSESLN